MYDYLKKHIDIIVISKPIMDNVIPTYAMKDIARGSLDSRSFSIEALNGLASEEFPDGDLVGTFSSPPLLFASLKVVINAM